LAITAAVEAIDRNMLERAWDELDFWRSHWASLGYIKLSEFVIQMTRVTTV
jgi:hypothetical protein